MATGRKPSPGSLLTPEATGGIHAGRGLDFQVRYAACLLPTWLLDEDFHQLFHEGTGDIDLRFTRRSVSRRKHVQVKDQDVTPSELRAVIEKFQGTDEHHQGVYERFTLVCPSLSPAARPVEAALARVRGAEPFFDDVPTALSSTEEGLTERLRKVGLEGSVEFIRTKVYVEVGHGDLRDDERAMELFTARLLRLPDYEALNPTLVEPAFAAVMRAISAKRGVAMDRDELEEIVRTAVRDASTEPSGVTLWVQNWTNESFDRASDYVVDWSDRFDRGTRRVPSVDAWDTELLPELRALQAQISAERAERLIHFRGKCALSSGLALGATFPTVGGWTFELPQPPSPENWRSDAPPTVPYELQTEVVVTESEGTDLVLGLNIRGDGRDDVKRYVEGEGLRPRLYAFVAPPAQGAQAIRGPEDACAFALAVRDVLGGLVKDHRILRTHMFFYGPLALSIFVGQQLTSVGEVRAYEYQDPGYVQSFTLRT